MLDKNAVLVLTALDKMVDDGYKILEKKDISDNITDNDSIDIDAALQNLADRNYVILKYSDDEEYCLTLTAQARAFIKELNLIPIAKIDSKTVIKKDKTGRNILALNVGEGEDREEAIITSLGNLIEEPPKKRFGNWKHFVTGIAGGVIGGGIVSIIFYVIMIFA